ncbi:MAG: type IV pili methyl-accepting chemotaxis transducer N-terminal domain-containing protein, partial [gamma proteobacterium symbiont of Lucinoma myriamae]|nr:type IV pili methyl-accepting chemotaxis transducer N-terminal domain-containing protein [gamma proteobacterium symbiont of Lucinoma myriamae]
ALPYKFQKTISLASNSLYFYPLIFLKSQKYNTSELINIAGMQRMLSQKIAKAYFFYGQGVRPVKTQKQLMDSIALFNKNYNILLSNLSDENILDMLVFIEMSKDELLPLAKQPFDKDNGSLMLDYSETLLEASNDIVKRIEDTTKTKKDKIVNLSGRQRMLTQRIAKFYITYQSGFKDINTSKQLKQSMKEFEEAHLILGNTKQNTSQITTELNKVAKLWNIVSKFYKDVERGGLPVIVLSSTDKIMTTMNHVTKLYVELGKQ